MTKKIVPLLLALALCLAGCHKVVEDEDVLTLYASFYPIYALTCVVCRDVPGTQVKCLTMPQDGCLRDYALSEWDALMLSGADALVLGGRGLERFTASLERAGFPLVLAMEGLELMEGEDEQAGEESHWAGDDPWLFLDPTGAEEIVRAIGGGLTLLDPGNAGRYDENVEAEAARLAALAGEMALPEGGRVAVMHEGLIYFARAMNLTVVGQVEREPAAALAGNELAQALGTLAQSGARVVLIERQAPDSLSRALTEAGYAPVRIDTLTTHAQYDPEVYYAAMRENAAAVKAALAGNP